MPWGWDYMWNKELSYMSNGENPYRHTFWKTVHNILKKPSNNQKGLRQQSLGLVKSKM